MNAKSARFLVFFLGVLITLAGSALAEMRALSSADNRRPAVFIDFNETYAIDKEGNVFIWGGMTSAPRRLSNISNAVDCVVDSGYDPSPIDHYAYFLLGDGTLLRWDSSGGLPSTVSVPGRVVEIEGDGRVLFLRLEDGTVWGRGKNQLGQLGLGHNNVVNDFTRVPSLANIIDISSWGYSSLAVRADGTVWAWGRTNYGDGDLGTGIVDTCTIVVNNSNVDAKCVKTPRQIKGLSNIVSVAGSLPSYMALDSSGHIWVWGEGSSGLLGDGSGVQTVRTPAKVSSLDDVAQIAIGFYSYLARKTDGTVWAWGQKIDGVWPFGDVSLTPSRVSGLSGATGIFMSPNEDRAFALKSDGRLWGWGQNDGEGDYNNYLLGDGTNQNRASPAAVLGENGIGFMNLFSTSQTDPPAPPPPPSNPFPLRQAAPPLINTYGSITTLIDRVGNVYALGDDFRYPTPIYGLPDIVDADMGGSYTYGYFVAKDGRLIELDQNGNFKEVAGMTNVVSVKGTPYNATALKGDGSLWVIGGVGIEASALESGSLSWTQFSKVKDLTEVVEIGGNMVLRSDGTVYSWSAASRRPLRVNGLSNIVTVQGAPVGMDGHAWYNNGSSMSVVPNIDNLAKLIFRRAGNWLALKRDGTVWFMGEIADGVRWGEKVYSPTRISGLANIVDIATDNEEQVFALAADGKVWSWGAGPLGNGGYDPSPTPVRVAGVDGSGLMNLFAQDSTQPVSLRIAGPTSVRSGAVTTFNAVVGYAGGAAIIVQPNWEVIGSGASIDRDGRLLAAFASSNVSVTLKATYGLLTATKTVQLTANTPLASQPQLYAGDSRTLLKMPGGTIMSWGYNATGSLGDSTYKTRSAAVQVEDLTGVKQVTTSTSGSFALTEDGRVWQWGGGLYVMKQYEPKLIPGLENIEFIAPMRIGGIRAWRDDGKLLEWRWDTPVVLNSAPANLIDIEDCILLDSSGSVFVQTSNQAAFAKVNGLPPVRQIAVSSGFSFNMCIDAVDAFYAIDYGNNVWSWGSNNNGRLGRGGDPSVPAKIPGLSGIKSVDGSLERAFAVDNSGFVWAWGRGFRGNYGTEQNAVYSMPVKIDELRDVEQISSGMDHAVALKKDGTLSAFGRNVDAELGNGTISNQDFFTLVVKKDLSGFLDAYPSRPNLIDPGNVPAVMSASHLEGSRNALTLDVEMNLNRLNMSSALARSVNPVYSVYVAALVPGSILGTSHPAVFTLNSANAWGQYLGGPLPEFMYNVEVASADQRLLLQILTRVNVSNLVGTTIYVGYGTSDAEMLQSGRYRAVYTVSDPGE